MCVIIYTYNNGSKTRVKHSPMDYFIKKMISSFLNVFAKNILGIIIFIATTPPAGRLPD